MSESYLDNRSKNHATHVAEELKWMERGEAIAIIWSIGDVTMTAKGMDIELSDEEARHVLRLLSHKHDADIGISWDTIEAWIDYVVDNRESSK